nr:hypothetical protein [Rhodococcus zopfii]
MLSNRVGGDTIEARLTALDAAVDGLLDDDMTGFARDDLVEFFQRFETLLRKATGVGHRAVVEAAERRVPEDLGCRSINDFLIGTLPISAADAARRVKGARKVGVWHTTGGDGLDPDLPAAVAKTMRRVPRMAGFGEIRVAEKILADAARSVTPRRSPGSARICSRI